MKVLIVYVLVVLGLRFVGLIIVINGLLGVFLKIIGKLFSYWFYFINRILKIF